MTSRLASGQPLSMAGLQHTSGIFADMTVDGPEIGTLVLVVDRAKNLPNRKAMGKQNPYCAARLGKEAKKTDTDQRGGQTPRWDQELRFVVHESPDYNNLKISAFSEDKRTELIGEAWVNLEGVVIPGGGKNDLWQTLTCKGKYAGEVRIELTYYDSRPKPERRMVEEEPRLAKPPSADRVKRRPLPGNPNASRSTTTPESISELAAPGRAKHGPRDFRTLPRANSLPPEPIATPPSLHTLAPQEAYASSPITQQPYRQTSHDHYQPEYHQPDYYPHLAKSQSFEEASDQPDFLPSLPPSRQRAPAIAQQSSSNYHQPPPAMPMPMPMQASHIGLPHAYSESAIPQYHNNHFDPNQEFDLHTEAPEPLPDLDFQHRYIQRRQMTTDASPEWANPYENRDESYLYHSEHGPDRGPPPPPPTHTRSAPIIPSAQPSPLSMSPAEHAPGRNSHGRSPVSPMPGDHQNYASRQSPMQSIEQGRFGSPQSSPQSYHPNAATRDRRALPSYGTSPPNNPTPGGMTPPHLRSSAGRAAMQHRHSVGDPYSVTPARQAASAHPLSQEVPRARSPMPERYQQHPEYEDHPQFREYNSAEGLPLLRPRAISPARQAASDGPRQNEWRPKNTYNIQNPVRAFESSDGNPLSTSQPRGSLHGTTRKSVSPHSSSSQLYSGSSIPFGPDSFDVHNPSMRQSGTSVAKDKPTITGWDGREIDPSDHLPVASWAPEPEAKGPAKTYGLGRDRDFGPRTADSSATRLSKDTVVNVRRRGQSTDATPSPTIKARLGKKLGLSGSPVEPLGEHANYNPVPDPYAQREYSRGFANGSIGRKSGGFEDDDYQSSSYGPPSLPPKVPLDYSRESYGQDALSREIASIDIGTGSRSRAPIAFVPVRSHRERDMYH